MARWRGSEPTPPGEPRPTRPTRPDPTCPGQPTPRGHEPTPRANATRSRADATRSRADVTSRRHEVICEGFFDDATRSSVRDFLTTPRGHEPRWVRKFLLSPPECPTLWVIVSRARMIVQMGDSAARYRTMGHISRGPLWWECVFFSDV